MKLLDDDGENQAVRRLLTCYGGGGSKTIGTIKLANAMTVEPVAHFNMAINETVGCIAYEYGKHNLKSGTPLYLHPPQQVAVTSSERAELIQWLRRAHEVFGNKNSKTIADMLEADDAFRPDWVNYRQGVKDGKADAQQTKQVPMTDEQISQMWNEAHDDTTPRMLPHVLARAIEAHHGIGGEA